MKDHSATQFTITVNGIEIKMDHEKLVAADVLVLAAEHHAFKGEPKLYVLTSDDPERDFKNEEWVDFLTYKVFSAERATPTPIADTVIT